MKKWWNWLLLFALFCLLFIIIPLSLSDETSVEELKPMFDKYIDKFNKSYKDNPDEYATRFQHFVASVREIEKLNAGSRGPDSCKAQYGFTKLTDMSKTEFKEIHLSDQKSVLRRQKSSLKLEKSWNQYKDPTEKNVGNDSDDGDDDDDDNDDDDDDDDAHNNHQRNRKNRGGGSHDNIYIIIRKKRSLLPLKVDWRTKGVVGPVRDQGLCGACWAFSTIGTMETMSAIKTGKLSSLSVQEAIDCAGFGNSGCAGGDICLLLDWLSLTDTPVEKEMEYPLKLTNGVCKSKKNATGVKVLSFTCDDLTGAEDKILETLALHGPVTVAVNALTWQNYLGGVIQFHCSGAPLDLNHAVQLIGYDLTAEVPYYIAKNSWGKEFGNAGYIHLAIGTNVCGLANEVASVDVQ